MSFATFILWQQKDGTAPRLSTSPHDPGEARQLTESEEWLWEQVVALRLRYEPSVVGQFPFPQGVR